MVSVLPFHAPIELAEQYALLDQISGGRVDIGVGSGYIGLELDAFGVTPEQKRRQFDDAYETLLRALRGDPVAVHPGSTPEVRLNVRPVAPSPPPVWIAVQRREAIPFVARRGAHVALVPYATLDDLEALATLIHEYRAGLPNGVPGWVSVAYHLYLGPHVREARSALQRFLDSRRATQSTFYLQQVAKDPRHASAEHLESIGLAALGDEAVVRPRLEALRAIGVDEVLGIVDFGALPLAEAEGTLRGLGRLATGLR
jgi:alkanesulfonate monooxygenase SsuD/methylene tetrahydromethanopterin reductase-like flavin-dependent oxidoreductase (luciferase family)